MCNQRDYVLLVHCICISILIKEIGIAHVYIHVHVLLSATCIHNYTCSISTLNGLEFSLASIV